MPRIKINKLPEGYQIKNGKITSNTMARKKKLPSYQAAPYKIANPYTAPEASAPSASADPRTYGWGGDYRNFWPTYDTDFYNRQRLSPDPDAYSPNQVSGQTGGFNYDPWGSTRKDPRVIPSAYMSSPPLSPMEIKDNAMVPLPTRAEARRERLNNERAEQFRREMIPGYAEKHDEAADLSSLVTSEPRMPLSPDARTAFETSSPLHEISPNQDLSMQGKAKAQRTSLPYMDSPSPSPMEIEDSPMIPYDDPSAYTTMPGADTSKPGGREKRPGEGFNWGGVEKAAPGILAGSAALWGMSQLGKNKKKPTRTNPYANLWNTQMQSRRPRRGSGMDIPTAMSLGFTQSYPSLYAKKGGNLPMYQNAEGKLPISREVGDNVLKYRNVANTFHQDLMNTYGQRDLQATPGYSPTEASQLSGYPGYIEAMQYLEGQNPNLATKDTSGTVEGQVPYDQQYIGNKHFNYRGLDYPEWGQAITKKAKKGGNLPTYQRSEEEIPIYAGERKLGTAPKGMTILAAGDPLVEEIKGRYKSFNYGGQLPMYQAASGRLSDRIRPGSRNISASGMSTTPGKLSYGTLQGNNMLQGADIADLPTYNPAAQNDPNPDANMYTVPNMFYAQQGGKLPEYQISNEAIIGGDTPTLEEIRQGMATGEGIPEEESIGLSETYKFKPKKRSTAGQIATILGSAALGAGAGYLQGTAKEKQHLKDLKSSYAQELDEYNTNKANVPYFPADHPMTPGGPSSQSAHTHNPYQPFSSEEDYIKDREEPFQKRSTVAGAVLGTGVGIPLNILLNKRRKNKEKKRVREDNELLDFLMEKEGEDTTIAPNPQKKQRGGNIYNQQNPHPGAKFEAERGEVIEHPPGNPAIALAHGGTTRNADNYQKITGNLHSDKDGGPQFAGAGGGFMHSDFINVPKDLAKQLEYLT